MKRLVIIYEHQKHKDHIWSVHYPGILERCVRCKVYKYMWNSYLKGYKMVDIGTVGNWKLKELEYLK